METKKIDLATLCTEKSVTAKFTFGAAHKTRSWAAQNWRVALSYQGRRLSVDFFGGAAVTNLTVADVISSLCLDVPYGEMTFEEFCSELGVDTDSRKEYATWLTCVKMAPRVRKFLGADFDAFASAEH